MTDVLQLVILSLGAQQKLILMDNMLRDIGAIVTASVREQARTFIYPSWVIGIID